MSCTQGIVFNIQKFSLNDGPGIRTVVFFKGCPLRCRWCSNPESQLKHPQLMWQADRCLHCHRCVSLCPEAALQFPSPASGAGAEAISINQQHCTMCGLCMDSCPGKALHTEGMTRSVEEIMDIVLQDLPFYEESGGGITLSGGEMLSQPDFAVGLLTECREKHIHTCAETTGYASPDVFSRVAVYLDCILFDVKHYDNARHREGTGVGNEQILVNLAWAIRSGMDVLPRIPVIPGFNDSAADAAGLAECILRSGSSRCQLLPFHQYGEGKYSQLGREYGLKNITAYHQEDLLSYRQVFLDHGVDAFF